MYNKIENEVSLFHLFT